MNSIKSLWVFSFSFALCLCGGARAEDRCNRVPPEVRNFLQGNAAEHIVSLGDLVKDDRALWEQYHRRECPGFAVVKLAEGRTSYAVALLDRATASERLAVIKRNGARLAQTTLAGPTHVESPLVVWKAGPGKSFDYRTGKHVVIKYDSIIYEKMESASTQYYVSSGTFRSLIAAQ